MRTRRLLKREPHAQCCSEYAQALVTVVFLSSAPFIPCSSSVYSTGSAVLSLCIPASLGEAS